MHPPTSLDRHVVRVAVAATMVIHGVARVANGTVGGFGEFLSSQGFPVGVVLAWVLTVVEIAGGAALALGIAVRPLCVWFATELAAGIVMVHAPSGWFVVGSGNNGMEYSVVLIACLVSVFLSRRVAATSS